MTTATHGKITDSVRALECGRSRGPRESLVHDCVLVAGARGAAATAPRGDEAEHRMVVRERRNACRPVTSAALKGGGWNKPPSTATNTRELARPDARLEQIPDTELAADLFPHIRIEFR
jgi:hypothetical protein